MREFMRMWHRDVTGGESSSPGQDPAGSLERKRPAISWLSPGATVNVGWFFVVVYQFGRLARRWKAPRLDCE